MINTLCSCTVQYKYEYSTEYTVQYSTKCIIIFCSAQFYWGGLAHCTVQSVSLFFARLNFIWGGGLKHPQALMTRRPCLSLISLILVFSTMYIIYL